VSRLLLLQFCALVERCPAGLHTRSVRCGTDCAARSKAPTFVTQAAKDFGVSDTTVNERLKGRRTHEEAAEDQQRLTPAQERVLVEWIKRCAARNMGLTTQSIIDAACRIAGCECGERWLRGFRERHKDELRGKWARGQEAPRAQSLNHANVDAFFELLRVLFEEYGIDAENLYNMDEKGLLLGLGAHTFVLVDRNADTVKVVEDGNRELVIIIECVCADGTSIRPGVIFKGARRDLEWGRNNPIDARCAVSSIYPMSASILTSYPVSRSRRRAGRTRSLTLSGW
jgi:hypothetical protein